MTLDQLKYLKRRLFTKQANGDEESMKGPAPSEETIIKFLSRKPRPTDEQFHEWAESKGFNVHKAEQTAYRVLSDLLNRGKSHGIKPSGIPKSEVKQGISVEKEHTPNPKMARKIVADHHAELGRGYYPNLMKMEKSMKKEGCAAGLAKSLKKKMAKKAAAETCPFTGKPIPKGRGRGLKIRHRLAEMAKKGAAEDTISMDVPLFIRMLEWAHEDAKTDMQLHQATKNLLGMQGPLTMKNYEAAVGGKEMPAIPSPMGKKADIFIEGLVDEMEKDAARFRAPLGTFRKGFKKSGFKVRMG